MKTAETFGITPHLQTLSLLLERVPPSVTRPWPHAGGGCGPAARHQHEQLASYRQEFQQRWTNSFTTAGCCDGHRGLLPVLRPGASTRPSGPANTTSEPCRLRVSV